MSAWAGSVAQVLGSQGAAAGAGFLVGDGVLVTCAHVVKNAGSGIGGEVVLRFPHAGGAPEAVGRVLAEGWQPPEGQDIALIGLDRMPDGLRPLQLAGSVGRRGHPVRSFGFPAQAGSDGHFGYGQAGDLLRPSLLQLTGANDLTEGFSGGPVWDDKVDAVIGMITAVTRPDRLDRGTGIGYATSTTALRAAWPALTVEDTCPYRGIEPFGAGDAGLFHGRDRAVRTILDALADRPALLLLLGPSGSGKSSLIRAGVLPRLAAGDLPGSRQWTIEVVRPAPPLPTGHDLLVIDQFEEMLAEPGAAASLAEQITAIARPGRTVLLVMRDDFYARLAAEAPSLLDTSRPDRLKPRIINVPATLGRDELHDIIVAPAESARACLQDGLAERIIDDVLDGRVRAATTVLPLLEVTLKQLWENQSDGLLTRRAYDGFGGLSGSITTWCDQVISGLPEPVTRGLLTMLVRPADPEHNIPAVRRRRRLSDLCEADSDSGTVLDGLIAGRVVVTSMPDSGGEPVAELAHDALIDRWYTLRTWADQDTAYQRWLHRAEERRHQWAERSDPADLLRGRDLAEGHEWSAQRRLPHEVAGFLRASQDRQHTRIRLARWLITVLTGLLAIVLALAGMVVWQWQNAVDARNDALTGEQIGLSRELAIRSTALLPTDSDVAGLLAVQAFRTEPTDESVGSLRAVVARPIAHILTGHAKTVAAVAYSPEGTYLASAGWDDAVRLWDPVTGDSRTLSGHSVPVTSLVFSPDGAHLAGGGEDATVRIWDVATSGSHVLTGHTTPVTSIAYSPDGTHLASADAKGTILVSDAATGRSRTLAGHTTPVTSIAYSPDGTHLAAAADKTVRIWNLATGRSQTLTGHTTPVTSIAYSPDSTHLASAAWGETIRVWDLATGKHDIVTSHTSGITPLAYSPDGTRLASGEDNTIRIWDPASGKSQALTGHTGRVTSIVYSPDGTRVASGSEDRTVRLWDLNMGGSPTFTGHTDAVTAVVHSPDGAQLTSAGSDGTIRVRNSVTGESRTLTGHKAAVFAVVYSPDGKRLASAAADQTVRIWDLVTNGSRSLTGHTENMTALAYSPDGERLAGAGSNGTVQVWDVATGRSRAFEGHGGWVSAVAFSPDYEHLASASWDKTVRIWDLNTGRSRVLHGHTDTVTTVAYSPAGEQLASAGWDATVRVWDLDTGRSRTLEGHAGTVTAVVYSPDGEDLASAGEDKTVRVWSGVGMAPPEMIAFICDRLHRDFSPDERERYLQSDDTDSPVCPVLR